MEQMYITRLEHVCSRLTKMGLTQMIVSDPLSIRYLTCLLYTSPSPRD